MIVMDTKQKLINLVSALETEGSIDYFYTFIALKLHGKADCPSSHFTEICEMWDKHMKSQIKKQEQKKTEQTPEEKKIAAYRVSIMRKVYDIESLDILNYIKIIIDDIFKEWEQKKGMAVCVRTGGEEERKRTDIVKLLSGIDNLWVLDQIQTYIVNMIKEGGD